VLLPDDADIALAAATAAADAAARLQSTVTRTTKADGSPVTEGDLAADAAIRAVLAKHRPDDGILSEEVADDGARLAKRRVWIIDPIDGTKEYLAGNDGWAVQVALAIDGRIALGVLALPRLGGLALGIVGQGAWRIQPDGSRTPLVCASGNDDVLIASPSARNRDGQERVRAALPELRTLMIYSIGVKTWRIILGDAGVYTHTRLLAEWDAAAPAALLLAAGGHATDLAGNALRFNQPKPYCPGALYSKRADHADLAKRLADAGVGVS
jgi:3'-phosphoadenosine 5'-phosphosulfate (PAPS) 3'-phosphatase